MDQIYFFSINPSKWSKAENNGIGAVNIGEWVPLRPNAIRYGDVAVVVSVPPVVVRAGSDFRRAAERYHRLRLSSWRRWYQPHASLLHHRVPIQAGEHRSLSSCFSLILCFSSPEIACMLLQFQFSIWIMCLDAEKTWIRGNQVQYQDVRKKIENNF